jgi:hypothetical protein
MMRPSFARSFLIALLLTAVPSTATAASTRSPTPSANDTTRLTRLITKGTAEIDRRVAGLNAALAKLQASTRLTASDKEALVKQIQDELTGLTNLKTKLAAETTVAAARADVQSIVTDYRVYALMLPKARLVAATDRLTVAQTKLTDLANTLQTRLTAAKSQGHNVDALQAVHNGMNAKVAEAAKQTNGLTAQLLAIQPSDYNANHAALMTSRQALAAAATNLKGARTDAKTIIDGLKTLK